MESLVQLGVSGVIGLAVFRSLETGDAYIWTKVVERSKHKLAYWAWVDLGALVALASAYYGFEGLL